MKAWLRYLAEILILFSLIWLNAFFIFQQNKISTLTYVYFSYRRIIIVLLNIIIGAIIGYGHLHSEMQKPGHLKVNLPKLILLGVPSLYFSLFTVLAYSKINFIYKPILDIKYINANISFILIFELLLGWVLVTSFVKREEKSESASELTASADH